MHRLQDTQLGKISSEDEGSVEETEPTSLAQQRPVKKRNLQDVSSALLDFLEKSDKQAVSKCQSRFPCCYCP